MLLKLRSTVAVVMGSTVTIGASFDKFGNAATMSPWPTISFDKTYVLNHSGVAQR